MGEESTPGAVGPEVLEGSGRDELLGQGDFDAVAVLVENVQACLRHVARGGLRDHDLLAHERQTLLLCRALVAQEQHANVVLLRF